ncbi:ABC-type cobalamin/Fe3+-siderophore transport system, ATPase component [Sphaerochaeta pleomorpha str. Grapes]|uniref:ABC-type cobalamin/Fe3+-siderophore transport system, ATPase component n=1 Tax=Sphaerochaeta pleomorpha (strain ATCC BAA-1885 / DSM 22778 / Grapes) TaxID=158190 RepID=G8QR48_SPHPG|nr:ABC transporter ATP-binding protein [Sphaerochaeta pleomorpha]AEV30983.1 ABC-type cobalamin/Fe3+-siderophore transport system, ATPase component [Sphaerochaeta pleomorpha str. Grapes]
MLSLESIYTSYGQKQILENLSIGFPKASFVAIIGKNGCGKSTLVKTACALVKPTKGKVLLDGKERKAYGEKPWAQKVSMLSQMQSNPSLSVETLVMHGRFPYQHFSRNPSERDWHIVQKAIQRMDLEKLRYKNLQSLSGGERQKAYLAMVLAQDTDYVFLDEPTTFLDLGFQREIICLMQELRDEGKGVVAVLHDINSALLYCDAICLMENGKILSYDSPGHTEQSALISKAFSVQTEKVQGKNGYTYLFF